MIFQFFFPYGQSPWPIFPQLSWQKPDRKGETVREEIGKPPRFGNREWHVLSRWIFPNRFLV